MRSGWAGSCNQKQSLCCCQIPGPGMIGNPDPRLSRALPSEICLRVIGGFYTVSSLLWEGESVTSPGVTCP